MTSGFREEVGEAKASGPGHSWVAERLQAVYEKSLCVELASTLTEDLQAATQLRMAVGEALALLKLQGQAEEEARAAVREAMRARLRCTAKALHRKYLRLQGPLREALPQAPSHRRPLAESQRGGPATVLESIRRTARTSPTLSPSSAPPADGLARLSHGAQQAQVLPLAEATARKVAAEKLLALKARRRREYMLQACMVLETQSFLSPEGQDVRERATAARRLGQFLQSLTLQLDPVCHSLAAANREQRQPSNFRLFVDALRLTYGDLPVLRALSEEFDLDLATQPQPQPQLLSPTSTAAWIHKPRRVRRSSSFGEPSPRKRSREEFETDKEATAAPVAGRTVAAATPAWKSNSTGTFITRSNSAPSGSALARRLQARGRSSGMVLHTVTVTSRRPGVVAQGSASNPHKLRRT